MKRGGPLRVDPEKVSAWQRKSALKASKARAIRQKHLNGKQKRNREARENDTPGLVTSTTKGSQPRSRAPRRNDGPWRKAVEELRGSWCRRCGTRRDLQCDHVVNRSQQGPSIVENGMMLCRECHRMITENEIKYRWSWLDYDQVAWLAKIGWVEWQADGMPTGRGMRYFEPIGS